MSGTASKEPVAQDSLHRTKIRKETRYSEKEVARCCSSLCKHAR